MNPTSLFNDNVIIVDITYINSVAADFKHDFEKILGHSVNPIDIPTMLDCVALDGGLRPGDNKIQVIFIYKKNKEYSYLKPSNILSLDGIAFQSNLGEFSIVSLPLEETLVDVNSFFLDLVTIAIETKSVSNIILIPNMDIDESKILSISPKGQKAITLLTMNPHQQQEFKTDMLGFSLLKAMNIDSRELQNL